MKHNFVRGVMAHFSYTLNLGTEWHTFSSNMTTYSTFEIDFKFKQAELWIPQSFFAQKTLSSNFTPCIVLG